MVSWSIQRPTAADLAAIRGLLAASNLPSEDVAEHLDHFLSAWDGKRLAGVVGMEIHNTGGLLRSLAVDPAYRGTGLGKALTQKILSHAISNGVTNAGLLTTTAANFFARHGFLPILREEIPEWIKTSKEYRLYCPSTAVCMIKQLAR